MILRRGVILPAVLISCVLCTGSVAAADTVTPSEMVTVLRNTHVLKPEVALHATYDEHNKLAVVLTDRNPKALEKDCKIDAVLVAKKLVDSFPNDINTVRVIFSVPGKDDAKQVDVTKVDVKAYGSGAVKADELLSSLNLVQPKTDNDSGTGIGDSAGLGVAPGPLEGQRLILLGRIQALKNRGTGVSAFQALFDKIEAEAKAGDQTSLSKDVPDLRQKLDEQSELVKQAQDSENGRGLMYRGGAPQGGPRQHQGRRSPGTGQGDGEESRQMLLSRCQMWAGIVSKSNMPPNDKQGVMKSLTNIQSMAQSSDPQILRQAGDQFKQLRAGLIQAGLRQGQQQRGGGQR